jgi:hypothetical protein
LSQEQIFIQWESTCNKLKSLKSFVQNDFNRMLHDGYVTKENIKESILEFNELYSNALNEISGLKTEIEKLLNKYAE